MVWLLLAVGLVFIVEGLAYALAPRFIETFLVTLRRMPIFQRRVVGLFAMALGLVMVSIAFWVGV